MFHSSECNKSLTSVYFVWNSISSFLFFCLSHRTWGFSRPTSPDRNRCGPRHQRVHGSGMWVPLLNCWVCFIRRRRALIDANTAFNNGSATSQCICAILFLIDVYMGHCSPSANADRCQTALLRCFPSNHQDAT